MNFKNLPKYCICGKQFKLPLGVKVYPSHWNKTKQEAYISPNLSESDNHNNRIVNNTISRIKLLFAYVMEENYHIVVGNSDSGRNPTNMLKMIKEKVFSASNSGRKVAERDIFYTLYRAIDNDTVKESTKKPYRDTVARFEGFCKSEGIVLVSFDDISRDLLHRYQTYLRGCTAARRTTDGFLSAAHINNLINNLLHRLNCYAVKEELMSVNVFETLKHLKPLKENVKQGENTIALRDDEVLRLFLHKCKRAEDEDIKNMFCFSCCVGQRISDWGKIADSIQTIDGVTTFRIKQKKCGSLVNVALIFELAQRIVNLYHGQLPKVSGNKVNDRIKKIAKEAGVGCEEVVVYRQSGMSQDVVESKVHRYDLITSHTSRRTFITMLALREKSHRFIMEYSGHSDVHMIDKYTKLTTEEIRRFQVLKNEHPELVLKMIDYDHNPTSKAANIGRAVKAVVGAVCALVACIFS